MSSGTRASFAQGTSFRLKVTPGGMEHPKKRSKAAEEVSDEEKIMVDHKYDFFARVILKMAATTSAGNTSLAMMGDMLSVLQERDSSGACLA